LPVLISGSIGTGLFRPACENDNVEINNAAKTPEKNLIVFILIEIKKYQKIKITGIAVC
jgi:hypothetical protein